MNTVTFDDGSQLRRMFHQGEGETQEQLLARMQRDAIAEANARGTGIRKLVSERIDNPGRNDPCPCGSGEKYKKCCISKNWP